MSSHLNRRALIGAGIGAALTSPFAGAFSTFSTVANQAQAGAAQGGGCLLCQAAAATASSSAVTRGAASRRREPMLGSGARFRTAQDFRLRESSSSRAQAIIIQPSWILVPDGDRLKLLSNHEVVVRRDLIEEVRPVTTSSEGRVRADGHLLVPGFISGHTHSAAGTMTRGFIEENSLAAVQADDRTLPSRTLLRPMELMDRLSDAELDDLTALNLAEMVRSGCTTQVEMSLSLKQMKSYVRVARKFGIRGYPSGMVPGMTRLMPLWNRSSDQELVDSQQGTIQEIKENLEFAKTVNGADEGRIRPMIGPSLVVVHTRDTFMAVRAAAKELGNGIHLHLQGGWTIANRAALQRFWGKREIAIVQELGLLDERLFGAHLLGIDLVNDIPLLASSKSFTFAHCPAGAGAGVLPSSQPYPEALAAGVNTSIGLDTHSNDYLENIKLAVMQGRGRAQLLGRSSELPMVEPTIWHGLKSATLSAANGLGRKDLGRIVPGTKADLSTINVNGLFSGSGAAPVDPHNLLLYVNGLAVQNVMTNGVWQVRDGRMLFAEESELVKRAGVVAEKIWSQLRQEGFFVPMSR